MLIIRMFSKNKVQQYLISKQNTELLRYFASKPRYDKNP